MCLIGVVYGGMYERNGYIPNLASSNIVRTCIFIIHVDCLAQGLYAFCNVTAVGMYLFDCPSTSLTVVIHCYGIASFI